MPVSVERDRVINGTAFQLSQTTSEYCSSPSGNQPAGSASGPTNPCAVVEGETFPIQTPLFVFPLVVTDTAYLSSDLGNPTDQTVTVTQFGFEPTNGNAEVTSTTIKKTESNVTEQFSKTVLNSYETPESAVEGKPTRTAITATGGTKPTTHLTTYEYSPTWA